MYLKDRTGIKIVGFAPEAGQRQFNYTEALKDFLDIYFQTWIASGANTPKGDSELAVNLPQEI